MVYTEALSNNVNNLNQKEKLAFWLHNGQAQPEWQNLHHAQIMH
jgi:hypothetical protein